MIKNSCIRFFVGVHSRTVQGLGKLGSFFHWKKWVRISTGVVSSRCAVEYIGLLRRLARLCSRVGVCLSLSELSQIIIPHRLKNDDCHAEEAVCTSRLPGSSAISCLGWLPFFCLA